MGVDGAVIQLVTRCESEDEFVERFARFATETDVVVPALPHVSIGTTGRFVILLKDQSVIMSGRCEVTEVLPLAVAPGAPTRSARALMRMRLIEMDAHSAGIHLRLTARRAASVKPPTATAPPRPAVPSLSIVRTPPPVVPRTAAPLPSDAPVAPIAPSPPAAPPPVMPVATTQPVRTPAMPTLIGLPATLGPRSITVTAVSAPLEMETTEISPLPRLEKRLPGAAFTLPANPLSDLDAADLSSFVEFTLLETEGVDSAAIRTELSGDPQEPTQDAADVAPTTLVVRLDSRIEFAQRIARRYGPYAACVLVGLVVGLALRSRPRAAPAVRAPVAVAPVVAAPRVIPPPEEAPPSTPPVIAPTATAAVRSTVRGECMARVTTRPAGAAVFWGDAALGRSPIEHAPIGCGRATVSIRHERYSDVTRTITAEHGRNAVVSERLYRPPAKVFVTSSPPRALVRLNKRAFGPAPRRIGTLRFEHVRIEASLPGYQPWAKTVYLKEADTKIDVTLVPVPKPNVRRAVASPVPPSRGTPPPPARVPAVSPPARPL